MQSSKNNSIGLKFLLSTMAVVLFGTVQAQAPQGFISRLIEIKYTTELYLSHQIKKESGRTQNEIDSALANYNTLRWKVDGLVYQISSDMITRNSPAIMRKLDAWSYEKETASVSHSIQHYVASLKDIELIYNEGIAPQIYPTNKRTLNLTTNVFYLLKDSYSIVKGLSDMKTRKVMALVELLDHARLMGPGEVVKMGTPK
jgi:sulfite reductase alpha subunit-like flavoprotein